MCTHRCHWQNRLRQPLAHERLPLHLHPLLQRGQLQRFIRNDQRHSYHQFPGDLLAACVRDARCYREDRPRSSFRL